MNDDTMDSRIQYGADGHSASHGVDSHGETEAGWVEYFDDRISRLEDAISQIGDYLHTQQTGRGDDQRGAPMDSMGHMVRNAAQHQLVQHVSGHLSPQAQEFMHSLLGNLGPHELANVYQSPHAIALLQRAAQAEHHNSTGPQTAAPQGEDVWHKGGNVDADAQKEIEQYLQAFGPQGVTPDMAVAAYRRATGGGR